MAIMTKELLEAKIKYYETVPTQTENFSKFCKANGLNIEEFERVEVDSKYYEYKGRKYRKVRYVFFRKSVE